MKLQKLRTSVLLAMNVCAIAGFTMSLATPQLAHADWVCGSGTASGNGTKGTTSTCWDDGKSSSLVGGTSGGGSGIAPGGSGGGSSGVPTPMQQAHLEKCATAYGSYKGHSGPNPAYTTKFSNQYGWYALNSRAAEVDWTATSTATQPSGGPHCQGTSWRQNDATTFPAAVSCNGTVWAGNTTIVWVSAFTNDAWMVDVLAHEWAHQWGETSETVAKQVGDAAKQAYLQDGGQKCQ